MQQAVQIYGLPICAPVCKALPDHSSRIALAVMARMGAITLYQGYYIPRCCRGEGACRLVYDGKCIGNLYSGACCF